MLTCEHCADGGVAASLPHPTGLHIREHVLWVRQRPLQRVPSCDAHAGGHGSGLVAWLAHASRTAVLMHTQHAGGRKCPCVHMLDCMLQYLYNCSQGTCSRHWTLATRIHALAHIRMLSKQIERTAEQNHRSTTASVLSSNTTCWRLRLPEQQVVVYNTNGYNLMQ